MKKGAHGRLHVHVQPPSPSLLPSTFHLRTKYHTIHSAIHSAIHTVYPYPPLRRTNFHHPSPNAPRLLRLPVHDAPDDAADPALEALLVHDARGVEELRIVPLLLRTALAEKRLPARRRAHVRERKCVSWRRLGRRGCRL